jgi:hypothetical protein
MDIWRYFCRALPSDYVRIPPLDKDFLRLLFDKPGSDENICYQPPHQTYSELSFLELNGIL